MGLRDRLRDRLGQILGKTPPAPPTPKQPPPPIPKSVVSPVLTPTPTPVQAPVQAPAPMQAPEPAQAQAQAPAPAPTPEPAVAVGAIRSNNDSPGFSAHIRPSFTTSDKAFMVRVISEAERVDWTFPCEPGEFVVEAADRAGYVLPSSCRNGGCLTCTGLLTEGQAEITEDQYVLEDAHIAKGFRLLCITTVTSNCVFQSHQQEAVE